MFRLQAIAAVLHERNMPKRGQSDCVKQLWLALSGLKRSSEHKLIQFVPLGYLLLNILFAKPAAITLQETTPGTFGKVHATFRMMPRKHGHVPAVLRIILPLTSVIVM
jgi:hypothetical protein